MIEFFLILLVIFWLLGFIHIWFLNGIVFSLAAHPFTLHSLLLLLVIAVIVGLLPGIFRVIAGIILVFWLLSIFGFLVFFGLPQILIILLILSVVFSLF